MGRDRAVCNLLRLAREVLRAGSDGGEEGEGGEQMDAVDKQEVRVSRKIRRAFRKEGWGGRVAVVCPVDDHEGRVSMTYRKSLFWKAGWGDVCMGVRCWRGVERGNKKRRGGCR